MMALGERQEGQQAAQEAFPGRRVSACHSAGVNPAVLALLAVNPTLPLFLLDLVATPRAELLDRLLDDRDGGGAEGPFARLRKVRFRGYDNGISASDLARCLRLYVLKEVFKS